MKSSLLKPGFQSTIIIFFLLLFSSVAFSQTDTAPVSKDNKKRKEITVYAGASFNNLSVSSDTYESIITPGWTLGMNYRQGKFFYWQVGARYNNAVYTLKPYTSGGTFADSLDNVFSIKDIDIPITGGINVLSMTDKVVALRFFVSAVPAFTIGVGDNDINITKDNVNKFNLYGQGGVGLDVFFLTLEVGYNYGFMDMLQQTDGTEVQSKPGQVFLNLGFRW